MSNVGNIDNEGMYLGSAINLFHFCACLILLGVSISERVGGAKERAKTFENDSVNLRSEGEGGCQCYCHGCNVFAVFRPLLCKPLGPTLLALLFVVAPFFFRGLASLTVASVPFQGRRCFDTKRREKKKKKKTDVCVSVRSTKIQLH